MRLTLIALFACSSIAHADAISGPPDFCPEGSEAIECHGPDTCRVEGCTTDADCGAGRRCEPRALCVEEHCCSGALGCASGGVEHALRGCDATCDDGSPCVDRNVCVGEATDGDAGTGGTTDGGCCSVAGGGNELGGALFVALVVAVIVARTVRRS